MTGLQALPVCRLYRPHRRQAASHRVDAALDFRPGIRLWEAALLAMAMGQAQQMYWSCWPHRRQAASHRVDAALDSGLASDCGRQLRWRWDRRSRCTGLVGLIAGKPPPTGLMLPWISGLASDCGRQLCWRWRWDRRSRCTGLAGLIAGKPPPTGLMLPWISGLTPDCGRLLPQEHFDLDRAYRLYPTSKYNAHVTSSNAMTRLNSRTRVALCRYWLRRAPATAQQASDR